MRESKVTLQSMSMTVFNSYGDSLVEIVCRDAFDSTNIIQVSNIFNLQMMSVLIVFIMFRIYLSLCWNKYYCLTKMYTG